ncbi:PREDICTED: centrosomal protein C10orf90 homolog isoform X1 [Poecilia mexicana]|uniref:centrosomal protein C10orf90 homolog isoform X1 n=1 Tax=Poecilia mexicana TaxID=48701 RepID=UPI00072DD6E6|nr:PREDICTED: centrosomal protein C10orf90 homolog isoform X1 [Poecilia mexicana]
MRVSDVQLDPAVFMSNSPRQVRSPANGLSVADPGVMKVQLVGCKTNCSEKEQKQGVTNSSGTKPSSSELSYRVCIHREMPLRSCSSAVFLDKSLCISLAELAAGTRGVQAPLHRSALTCQLGEQSLFGSAVDKKTAKTKEAYRRGNFNRCNGQEQRPDHRGSPLSKRRGLRANQKAPACGANSKDDDSEKQRRSTSLGLSFREPSASNTKAAKQKGNANKATVSALSNFRHMQHTFTYSPVDSGSMMSKQGESQKTDEEQEGGKSTEPQIISTCRHRSPLKSDSVGGILKTLSLKEALELFRPDFISRSQGRVRHLEQKARRRKALQDSNLALGLKEEQGKQKRHCTTPDPLSDNLFKPRERSISGREMQLRSRRIYNKLPEVTKKKEEEKKRAISQTNRLRAEVFKKKVLDQILQR